MTGCPVSWKCRVACLPTDESQQPTWPHVRHSRSSTQRAPSRRHSTHPWGVRGARKSEPVSPSRCSHSSPIVFSFEEVYAVSTRVSVSEQDSATSGFSPIRGAAFGLSKQISCPPPPALGHLLNR